MAKLFSLFQGFVVLIQISCLSQEERNKCQLYGTCSACYLCWNVFVSDIFTTNLFTYFKFILKPYSLVPFIPLICPKPSPHYTYYSLIHYIIYKCIMISVPNLIRCKVPRGKRSLFLLLWMYSTCITQGVIHAV